MRRLWRASIVLAALCSAIPSLANSNKLFLNFDGDPTEPVFGPLKKFDAHDLNSAWGAAETNQLRSGILADVARDFREFDVDVTPVRPLSGLYYTIGVEGVAIDLGGGGATFGKSLFDYGVGRVYAASNSLFAEFQGANATIERFQNGLAGTAAHEAGHLFTLVHADAYPNSAEAALGRKPYHDLLATPELKQLTMEQRASINRNFGANDYEKLAAHLGLNNRTLANWDFRNPNSSAANDFHIKFLSKHPSLTVQSEYSGDPFGVPTLVRSSGQTPYDGMDYYEYELNWSGGAGVAPGGAFHAGISFAETNDFVVRDTFLTKDGVELPLSPRLPSFTGDPKSDGSYTVRMLNANDSLLTLRNLRVRLLPMMADLEKLLPSFINEPMTTDGDPIAPVADLRFPEPIELLAGGTAEITIDSLANWLARRQNTSNVPGGPLNNEVFDGQPTDPDDAAPFQLGMFPSTYVYVTADAVLPNQEIFDPTIGGFVTQDLVSEVFVQFAGVSHNVVPEPANLALVSMVAASICLPRRRR